MRASHFGIWPSKPKTGGRWQPPPRISGDLGDFPSPGTGVTAPGRRQV